MFDIIIQVLTSWQVIVITIAILLYINIVTHVSRRYRRPKSLNKIKMEIFKKKDKKSKAAPEGSEETLPGDDSNDELGLEEA
jgi:hypothetical protein